MSANEGRREGERAFLSNGMTSALECNGRIDWFPCPKFDSDSIFSSILDEGKGGFFSVEPDTEYTLKSNYIYNSMALMNLFETDAGKLELVDFLPLGVPAIARLYKSEVPFTVKIKPSFRFGLINPVVEEMQKGIVFKNGTSKEGLEVSIKGRYQMTDEGVLKMEKGEGYVFALYSKDLKYGLFGKDGFVYPDPYEAFDIMLKYAEEQISLAKTVRKFSEAYYRSIAVVLGMMYLPSGGIIASPTTSLPEIVGKSRNWDYRYVWVRDAAYAAEALASAEMLAKSRRILSFLISLIDPSSKSFDHPFYSIDGTAPQPEETLPWLRGSRNSRPVRIGNEAYVQMQADTEGAFMNGLYAYMLRSGDSSYMKESWWAIEAIAKWVSKSWRSKCISLWEDRSEPRHFVHSKVMDWVALDRSARIGEMMGYGEKPVRWKRASEEIREDIMSNGFSEKMGCFTSYYGSDDVDASLLTLPLYGFVDAKDPRFTATLEAIEKKFSAREGLLMRYGSDSMGGAQHPFTLLSTWLARVYIKRGEIGRAEKVLAGMLEYSNAHMLLGEHVDIETKEPRGNFPQLFPHAGLVQAISELEDARSGK